MNDAAQREYHTGLITLGLSDKLDVVSESHGISDVPRALTLTNLMLVWCFIIPFSCAMGFSKAGKCGIPLIFTYAMWQGFLFFINRLGKSDSAWIGVMIIFAGFIWIAVGGWAGGLAEEAFFPKQSAYLKACRTTHTCLTPQTSGQH